MMKYNVFNFQTLLLLSMASGDDSNFSLVQLPNSTPLGGKCLDGSPAGFYFRAGQYQFLFLINLEGGGYCSTNAECAQRALGNLGSSRFWDGTPSDEMLAKNRLLNDACESNPDFCEASTVYIPYCTGDGHLGTRPGPTDETFGFYFDGYHNFAAIIDMLIADYGLGDANSVLLTGVSAGGLGSLYLVDYLADRLPSAVVKAAPIAGWYNPGPHESDPWSMEVFSDYQHFAAGTHGNNYANENPFVNNLYGNWDIISDECIVDYREASSCMTLHNYYKYIQSSLYVVQAQYDPLQMMKMGWPDRIPSNETDFEYVEMMGEATRSSLEQIVNNEGYPFKPHPDGLFAASCVHHNAPLDLKINSLSWGELFYGWFFQNTQLQNNYQLVETCTYEEGEMKLPCNPKPYCRVPEPPTSEQWCRDGLAEKGCTAQGKTRRFCRDCALDNEQFLGHSGCTYDLARMICMEL